MESRVEITGGKRPVAFPWGAVPRDQARTFDLNPEQVEMVKGALDGQRIAGYRVLTQSQAVTPAPASVVETPVPVSGDPLVRLHVAVLGREPRGEIPRQDLVQMYVSMFGRKPGKKVDRSTIESELRDAAG